MLRKIAFILLLSAVPFLTTVSFAQDNTPDNVLYFLERGSSLHQYTLLMSVEFDAGIIGSSWPVMNLHDESISPPVFAPDGESIYFVAKPPFAYNEAGYIPDQIVSVSPDGSGYTTISPDDRYYTALSVSPDGSQFSFGTNPVTDAIGYRLAFMDTDGTNRRELDIGMAFNPQITWSPDGTQIAFGNYLGVTATDTIFLVDVSSGEIVNQVDLQLPASSNPINWGVDGQHLYFVASVSSEPPSTYFIHQYDSATDTLSVFNEELTVADSSVIISPDKSQLATYTFGEERNYYLTVLDITSGDIVQQVQLNAYPNEFENGPLAWSPNGQMIAYPQSMDENGTISQVFVLDVGSGEVQQISYNENGAAHPMWLPK